MKEIDSTLSRNLRTTELAILVDKARAKRNHANIEIKSVKPGKIIEIRKNENDNGGKGRTLFTQDTIQKCQGVEANNGQQSSEDYIR